MATKTVLCAAKSGFKLDHAKQDYQQTHFGRTVPWTDQFVDEMKRGLLACRVMYGPEHTTAIDAAARRR